MKGLFLKDLYMSLKYCRTYLLLVLVFAAASGFERNNVFLTMYPAIVLGMLPVSLIAYDERSGWKVYCDTFPYSRGQVVSAKYLMTLLGEGVVLIITAVAQGFGMVAAGSFAWQPYLQTLCLTVAIGLLGAALLLPFIFRLGAEKGRIAYFIVIGAMCAGSAVLGKLVQELPAAVSAQWFSYAAILAMGILFAVSWLVSIGIYRRREL